MSVLVSIVLPAYNAAATIRCALQSCLSQNFRDFEILVIDDGSTDETAAIVRSFGNPRIVLHTIPHAGVAQAMNFGLERASGKYIARMDADDEMHPERIEKQFAFLEAHPETGLVSSLVAHGGHKRKQGGYAEHIHWINSLVSADAIAMNRFVESPVCNPSVMFRRELVAEFGACRDGDFPEDYDMWLRWLDGGVRMEKIPEFLLTWNDLPARLTRNDPRYSPSAFENAKAGYLAKFIRENNSTNRPIWLCGAGRVTRRKSKLLIETGIMTGGYIDVDPKKIGRFYNELPVIGLKDLPPRAHAYIVSYVSTRGARSYIRAYLLEKGFAEGKDFVLAG